MMRSLKTLGILAWLVLAFGPPTYWIAWAQQEQAADDPRFTGLSSSLDAVNLRLSQRRFEAGARSAWHRHPGGQLLFAREGRGRVQKQGSVIRELNVGDSDYTAPNVLHWHGAAPDTHFIQAAMSFSQAETEWFERVTDDEYHGR